jgi:hypothetical protein
MGHLGPDQGRAGAPWLVEHTVALVCIIVAPRSCCQKILAITTTCCKTLMAGPLAVLPAGSVAVTTEAEEDIDGGSLWRVLSTGPIAVITEVEEDVDGGPAEGAVGGSSSGHLQS